MRSTRLIVAAGFALWACAAGAARAADAPPPGMTTDQLEQKTANEDMAALQFYRTSLNKLAVLCKQKENTAEEPVYLFRIAEAQYKVAALSFRLAHSSKAAREGHPDFREYHNSLDQLAKLATRIATKYPRHPDISRAIYLRGQAYKELEKDAEAIRDFRYLIDNFPQTDDMIPAQIALYELFNKTKDFKAAIYYLKRYQVPRTENYYPVSLDHLAFAEFSINDIPEALKYLEQELAVFPPQEAETGNGSYSEREKILINAVLFYYTGMEAKMPQYTIQGALPYFRRLNAGSVLGKMLGHFSNLLRSKGRDDDLEAFKKMVLAAQLAPSETAEVLLASIDNSLNKRRFDRLKDSTDDLTGMVTKITPDQRKTLKSEKMSKLLNEAASNLNQTFLKVKDTPDAARITPVLISVYSLMLKISDSDSAKRKIEFNMAEIFMGLKRYEAAALHYRWIAELRPAADAEGQKLQLQARFKSLTARYESLSEKKVFPKELAARPLKGSPETPLAKEATQWIDWLDQYEKAPHTDPSDAFQYEASRLIYSSGKVGEGVSRLLALIKAYPKSTYVVPASSLVLDTYVTSEQWDEALATASDFLKTADPSKTDFRNKLQTVASDSYFKTVETLYKNKSYSDALARAENFLKLYPASKRRQSCLVLAGNAALALKDKQRALTYFSPLMKEGSVSAETQGTALLTTAAVAEEKYDFAAAADSFRRYLTLPAKSLGLDPAELKGLRIKTLDYAWFAGQPALLKATLNTPAVCVAELSSECDKFAALLGLEDTARATDRALTARAVDRAGKSEGPAKAAWAALALENFRGVSFNTRIQLLGIVATGWDKLDPKAKYALLPVLSASIPGGLRQAAAEIRSMSKLKLEKADLDKRTNVIKKMDDAVTKVLDLPWQRIRTAALGELANIYGDFSKDLAALPAPAGLAGDDLKAYTDTINELRAPYVKRVDELRKQAIDAASDAGVEAETYNAVAAAYNAAHPPAAGAPKVTYSALKGPVAGLEVLEALKAPPALLAQAAAAVKSSNWGLLAYLLADAKEKNLLGEPQLGAARGVSLSLAGAQAEALAELKDSEAKLEKNGRLQVLAAIAAAYASVRSKNTKAALEEFLGESGRSSREQMLRPDFAVELADAATWSGAEVSKGTQQELAELGKRPRAPASQPKGK